VAVAPPRALLTRLEEAAFNAWPARRTTLFHGWVIRSGGGYTKRANSVTPLYGSPSALEAAVDACERVYADAGLACTFRLTSLRPEPALDALLAGRGYARVEPSLVMHLDLAAWVAPRGAPPGATRSLSADEWLVCHAQFTGAAGPHPVHREILDAIAAERSLLAWEVEGRTVACGLGVREEEAFGLFDLATDPAARNRGYGAALVHAALRAARERGAGHAYLQVVAANAAAVHVYRKAGFDEAYTYAYRVRRAG
jgi:N-acetylglutamate synthase